MSTFESEPLPPQATPAATTAIPRAHFMAQIDYTAPVKNWAMGGIFSVVAAALPLAGCGLQATALPTEIVDRACECTTRECAEHETEAFVSHVLDHDQPVNRPTASRFRELAQRLGECVSAHVDTAWLDGQIARLDP
jgi:hypothetical protein